MSPLQLKYLEFSGFQALSPPFFCWGEAFEFSNSPNISGRVKPHFFPAADFYLPWILTPGLSPISGTGQRLLCACTLDLLGTFETWVMNAMCLFPCRKSRMSFWNQGCYIEHEGTFFGTFWTAGNEFQKRSPGPGGCFVVPDNLSVGNLRNQVHWLWDWCLDWTSFFLVCTCNVNPHAIIICESFQSPWWTVSCIGRKHEGQHLKQHMML